MPLVTKISEQKRRPNRRNVYLDGAFAFGCNLNVIARFYLREGMNLTEGQVRDIQLGAVKQECLDYGLDLLSKRLHSRDELGKKLSKREYGKEVVDAVLADLTRLGYLDDARFAATRALSAAQHKHHGRRRAYVELVKKGVKGEVAKKALDEVYSTESSIAVARELAQKQAARLRKLDPLTARRRLVGMLQRRGFEYEAIKPVVDEVLGDERRDED